MFLNFISNQFSSILSKDNFYDDLSKIKVKNHQFVPLTTQEKIKYFAIDLFKNLISILSLGNYKPNPFKEIETELNYQLSRINNRLLALASTQELIEFKKLINNFQENLGQSYSLAGHIRGYHKSPLNVDCSPVLTMIGQTIDYKEQVQKEFELKKIAEERLKTEQEEKQRKTNEEALLKAIEIRNNKLAAIREKIEGRKQRKVEKRVRACFDKWYERSQELSVVLLDGSKKINAKVVYSSKITNDDEFNMRYYLVIPGEPFRFSGHGFMNLQESQRFPNEPKCFRLDKLYTRGNGYYCNYAHGGRALFQKAVHQSFLRGYNGSLFINAAWNSPGFYVQMGCVCENDPEKTKKLIEIVKKAKAENKQADTEKENFSSLMVLSDEAKQRWKQVIFEGKKFEDVFKDII